MKHIKEISTKDLVKELSNRFGVRSIQINKEEIYKVQAVGLDNSRDRYIKGDGPAVIIEVVD